MIYSIILAPLGVLPFILGFAGLAYGSIAIAFAALFLLLAVRVFRVREGEAAKKAARDLFAFSILYLFVLFAALLGEALIMAPGA